MYIEKRGKNSYRIIKMKHGKKYRINLSYKPSKTLATELLNDKIRDNECTVYDPFIKCSIKYNDSKKSIIAPNSYRTYLRYSKSLPDAIRDIPLNKIDNLKLQQAINKYSENHSPKSVKSFSGYLMSVLNMFSNKRYRVTLPKIYKTDEYIPTIGDVNKLLNELKNTDVEILFILCSYGLRVSEALCLTENDIKSDYIDVNKTISYDEHYSKVIKGPKTVESKRKVYIPKELAKKIKNNLTFRSYKYLQKLLLQAEDKLNIPRFTFHKLRKFYASYLHLQNVPEKYILESGGWSTPNIMKSIYEKTYQVKPFYIPLKTF